MDRWSRPGPAAHQTTQFNAKTRRLAVLLPACFSALVVLAVILNCSTGGYWTPPKSTATLPTEIAFLLSPAPATYFAPTPYPPVEGTSTPLVSDPVALTPSPTQAAINTAPILYYTQAADTLPVVAVRFGVQPEQISSPEPLPATSLLPPNQLLIIPRVIANTTASQHLLPDSELVNSPSTTDFDIEAFVRQAGGKLGTYQEWLKSSGVNTGAQLIQRVATENSINPRILLSLLEYSSHWVYGEPTNAIEETYPMGLVDLNQKGLYRQLVWAVNQLSIGYYSWREGRLTEIRFKDGLAARIAPDLNAGSAALQYYFAQIYDAPGWVAALDLQQGLPALHERMFGSPWQRAQAVEPLYPPGLTQPPLSLPFEKGKVWSFTGGPHGAWEHEGSYAALDFAPPSGQPGCVESKAWVTASASGLVVRSGNGVVVLDLDGDGYEQTGWVLLYLHVSNDSSVPIGTWMDTGTPLGNPSCEGGTATGTHVHIARKYNGEWIAADGPMPFVLSGWVAHAGDMAYKGTLTRGEEVVIACTCSSRSTFIALSENDP